MKRSRIRSFNERGLAEFRQYVEQGKLAPEPPPISLLTNDKFSQEIASSDFIGARLFSTKFDMGMAVARAVEETDLPKLFADDGAWPWLSLFFHESTMPQKGGNWIIGAPSRHLIERIPGRHQDQSHRHLVKAATINVSRFGTFSRVLMDLPSGQSKIEEQVMSRSTGLQLSTSKPFVQALNKLYWDDDRHTVRKGARGDGSGSIMRLIRVLNQLDATFDFASLTADEIVQLLPEKEFLTPVSEARDRKAA